MTERQASTPADRKPARWLVVQTSAVLESVASSNLVCYGRTGVPRYPVGAPEPPPEAAATLCAELLVREAAGAVRLAWLDLELTLAKQDDWQVVWSAFDPARQLQVLWVWDFYRILSHAALRLRLPRIDQTAELPEAWRGVLDALRAVVPGDGVEFHVRSACGDIHQHHPLTAPAQEWEPAPAHER